MLEAVFVGATGSVVAAAVGTADVSSLATTGGEADGASVPHPLTTITRPAAMARDRLDPM